MEPITATYSEETSRNWSRDPDINYLFVNQVQNYCNDRLKVAGFVFLNDVLQELGLPRTREGQSLGWIEGSVIEFWKGEFPKMGTTVELKFNVDGDILDKIDWDAVRRR